MPRSTEPSVAALMQSTTPASRFALGVLLPLVFDATILTADVLEGPKTAYVGLLASAPMLAAVFGSVSMVALVSVLTWFAAFSFGLIASDGNVPAQTVRLFFIFVISLIAIASTAVRLQRERKYVNALVATAEAESLKRLAATDMMTGLLNRRGFFEVVDAVPARESSLAVVDIDGLKEINDEHGHPAGDAFIIAVAHRLQGQFRGKDLVARWGGDEFVIDIVATPEEAMGTLQRVIDSLSADPVAIDDAFISVSVSAGLAAWPVGVSFDAAYKAADTVMYQVKHSGGAAVRAAG